MVNDENVDAIISEIAGLSDGQISPSLYDTYSENLRNAVNHVFSPNGDNVLRDQLLSNVSLLSAYKAMNVTKLVRAELGNDLDEAGRIIRTANRLQATEYNTALSRCRTAKQFDKFKETADLFPNIRWLQSRSADPREAHREFWDRVWAKDDPFWGENTPGSLWNCKCDWEETDDPVTIGNPHGNQSARGLCGNPADTGEVFTTVISERQNVGYRAHPYFSTAEWHTVKSNIRNHIREVNATHMREYRNEELGLVLVDHISYIEASKGSLNEATYFLKMEVLDGIEKYSGRLVYLRSEEIDLSHNNRNSIYYRRKASFSNMEVYQLNVGGTTFIVKFGRFRTDGSLHLYSITG